MGLKKPKEDLHKFLSLHTSNIRNQNIQFTMKFSYCLISFMYIMLFKFQWNISTDVYYKAKDTHQYLNFKSRDFTRTKRNITYRRIWTILSEDTTKEQNMREFIIYMCQNNPNNSYIQP